MSDVSDVSELLEMVETAADSAMRSKFVPNLMVIGTDEHKAIECGIKIGSKFRASILSILDDADNLFRAKPSE